MVVVSYSTPKHALENASPYFVKEIGRVDTASQDTLRRMARAFRHAILFSLITSCLTSSRWAKISA
jgi:hypothetical protein